MTELEKSLAASWPSGVPPLRSVEPLVGGWVCETYRGVLVNGRQVVVKRSPYPADAEADGLLALASAGISVPEVLGVSDRVLVLEYLSGEPDWRRFGRMVARMHSIEGSAFGWHRNNRMGRYEQNNGWLENWSHFYCERRILAHLKDERIPADLALRLRSACAGRLQEVLPEKPRAVMTHGDLWIGNVVAGRWLIDPEVCFADRELDVAFMQRSESLPPEFWAAYERELPYDSGFGGRWHALQIHHILLQMRHFDAERYRPDLDEALRRYGC